MRGNIHAMKKKLFRVYYTINGNGTAIVEAKTSEEAKQNFQGTHPDYRDVLEQTENIEIVEIAEEG